MRPIFFTLLFLSSFAFGQKMTQEESERMEAAMQEEMACDDTKPGKGTVIDSNSGKNRKIVLLLKYTTLEQSPKIENPSYHLDYHP